MIKAVMDSVKNHFAMDRFDNLYFPPERGTFSIQGGILAGLKNKPLVGQYFAITGSVLNNGVYLAKDSLITLTGSNDEIFDGIIYRLVVPKDFVKLVEKIKTFSESEGGQASNITNASFGVQSYGYATDTNGVRATWETVFASQLNALNVRRMFMDIEV